MKRFQRAGHIQVGVIGYGGAFNMGRAHLNEMKRAGMTPAAVAEIDEARRDVAREDFPDIRVYADVRSMLRDPTLNLVTIITPHNTHAGLAAQCLKAGKHVVTEKPFTLTTAECDRIIKLARERDLVLSTYHNRHWDGCILRAVDQVVRKGVIGEVFRVRTEMGGYGMPKDWWRSSRSISGGVLYDWGVHLLEYALQVMDAEIVEVSGFAHEGYWPSQMKKSAPWKNDCNEDDAMAVVRFANGASLTVGVTHLNPCPPRALMEIRGTKGTYLMHHGEWETHIAGRRGILHKTGKNPRGQGWKFYQNVADHLTRGEPLVITPEWARRPIHVLDLAGRSARRNRALKARYA
jgi:predicted dehydrogenase